MNRNTTIDNLRGIAVLAMILIHGNAYYLSSKISNWSWNLSQYAVPMFVFCSAYIFFTHTASKKPIFNVDYFKKRLLRLFIPYYIFLIPYFIFVFFMGYKKITLEYITQNIFVTGGVDLNWLVLLFTYFIVVMPLVYVLSVKNKIAFCVFSMLAFTSSIYFLFFKSPVHYKWIMWLPWSTMIIIAWIYSKYENRKWLFPATLGISSLLFVIATSTNILLDHSLRHFDNKYPPNLYHLSYGMLCIAIMYEMAKQRIFEKLKVSKFLNYLSINSYPLYFIHFFIVFLLTSTRHYMYVKWYIFFVIVVVLSLAVQEGINRISNQK